MKIENRRKLIITLTEDMHKQFQSPIILKSGFKVPIPWRDMEKKKQITRMCNITNIEISEKYEYILIIDTSIKYHSSGVKYSVYDILSFMMDKDIDYLNFNRYVESIVIDEYIAICDEYNEYVVDSIVELGYLRKNTITGRIAELNCDDQTVVLDISENSKSLYYKDNIINILSIRSINE